MPSEGRASQQLMPVCLRLSTYPVLPLLLLLLQVIDAIPKQPSTTNIVLVMKRWAQHAAAAAAGAGVPGARASSHHLCSSCVAASLWISPVEINQSSG
jgi:hypothetical protein